MQRRHVGLVVYTLLPGLAAGAEGVVDITLVILAAMVFVLAVGVLFRRQFALRGLLLYYAIMAVSMAILLGGGFATVLMVVYFALPLLLLTDPRTRAELWGAAAAVEIAQ